jgi:hypothetical protein
MIAISKGRGFLLRMIIKSIQETTIGLGLPELNPCPSPSLHPVAREGDIGDEFVERPPWVD